jgi:hypothetical protein
MATVQNPSNSDTTVYVLLLMLETKFHTHMTRKLYICIYIF